MTYITERDEYDLDVHGEDRGLTRDEMIEAEQFGGDTDEPEHDGSCCECHECRPITGLDGRAI